MTTILVIPHVFLQYALEHRSTQAISYPPVYNSSIQLWNQQPENIKSSRSVQIIKSILQPQNNTKFIYYYNGTRLGQILHARLRMQCSSLNHHLFRKNIVNSPLSMWGNRNHGPFSATLSPSQCNKTEIYSHH